MPFIRPTRPADLAAIHAIYADEVRNRTASWELEPPDLEEMQRRYAAIVDAGYPYFVAEAEGGVVGYAYASAYRPRKAYRFTVENSIYVAPGQQGKGIGKTLLRALMDECADRGFRQMIAVIGDSGNLASRALHASLGFALIGVAPALGYKNGRWLDQVLMQAPLGTGAGSAPGELTRPA
jgi:phosphinothricin acetyltransferase